jgi:hypothetical protein
MDNSYRLLDLTVYGRQESVGGLAGRLAETAERRAHLPYRWTSHRPVASPEGRVFRRVRRGDNNRLAITCQCNRIGLCGEVFCCPQCSCYVPRTLMRSAESLVSKPRGKFGLYLLVFPDAQAAVRIETLAHHCCSEYCLQGEPRPRSILHVSLLNLGLYDDLKSPKFAALEASDAAEQVRATPFTVAFNYVQSFSHPDGRYPLVLRGDDGIVGLEKLYQCLGTCAPAACFRPAWSDRRFRAADPDRLARDHARDRRAADGGDARFAWWFRASNTRAVYRPDWAFSGTLELIVWAIPALVITFLGGIAWFGSHDARSLQAAAVAQQADRGRGRVARLEMAVHLSRTRASPRSTSWCFRPARRCISGSPRPA